MPLNVTLIEQFAFTATVAPHVFVCEKSPLFVPVSAMLLIFSVAWPVLVSVTDCEADVVPTVTPVKTRLDDERLVPEIATEVPERGMLCGAPGALFPMLSDALLLPPASGEYVTLIVQDAPGTSVPLQLPLCRKSPLFVPVMEIGESVKFATVVLVIVTVCGDDVVPTFWLLNVSDAGETVIVWSCTASWFPL